MPAGAAKRPGRGAQVGHQVAALVAVRPVRRVDGERGEVALGGGRERRRQIAVARAVRVPVEEPVLAEGQARVRVHEALDAGDARVRLEASRVVVERREVLRAGRIAGRPDRQHERGELALAEVGRETVEGRARRHARGQDRGVRGVEADVQERRAEHQQEQQRRHQHRDRMAHDPAGEPCPRAVDAVRRPHGPDRVAVDAVADDREDRGQQGQRGEDREPDHDRPGDPDGAQDHEFEEDQPEEAQQHGQAAEEHGPAGGGDGDPHRLGDAVGTGRPAGQLLAEAAREQQRVVHPQAEAQQRREVEHEDAHRDDGPDQEDARERDHDGRAADDQRHPGRDRGAEDEQQGDGGERQRDDLAPPEVRLGHALDVAVERRPAGELDGQPGRLVEPFAKDRQRVRRVVGRQVEEDDVVGGMPVGRDLPRGQEMRDHAGDVRGARDVGDGRRRGALEGGRPGLEGRTAEDDDERRRREAELAPEKGLRPCGFEVVEDEAAGRQHARDARGQGDRREQDERPRADHQPRPTRDETAEAIEGTHGTPIVDAGAVLGLRTIW